MQAPIQTIKNGKDWPILRSYSAFHATLSALHVRIEYSLLLKRRVCCYYPHLIDKETEGLRGQESFPMLQNLSTVEPELKPQQSHQRPDCKPLGPTASSQMQWVGVWQTCWET